MSEKYDLKPAQELAAWLSFCDFTQGEIANFVGVRERTVCSWFNNEPVVYDLWSLPWNKVVHSTLEGGVDIGMPGEFQVSLRKTIMDVVSVIQEPKDKLKAVKAVLRLVAWMASETGRG